MLEISPGTLSLIDERACLVVAVEEEPAFPTLLQAIVLAGDRLFLVGRDMMLGWMAIPTSIDLNSMEEQWDGLKAGTIRLLTPRLVP